MKKKKLLMTLLVGLGLASGGLMATNVSAATQLSSVPKSWRGTWKDYSSDGSQSYGKTHFTAKTTYYYQKSHGKYHKITYKFATRSSDIQDKTPVHNENYYYGHGKYAFWWQLSTSKYATMHPTYYRMTTKNIFGHKRHVLLTYTGILWGGALPTASIKAKG
ncbi:hypothetical protein YK48G_12530 [Lentilactobacillus fungorum]|uniref:Uncharacterized protein n=1 Tax=Lentilactobacillus fungorum TaxID=2201250 RepID=A0ABQ3VYM2_9LACO|nr:hypothetical protein [Lentilactobacillus fungorum]GHP13828.1 hypothetical protein YK48G_12530 [Lentilactobacillus fungorum]